MENIINGRYGGKERQTFDLFFADAKEPSPLVIFIHGGGFVAGSKEKLPEEDKLKCLENGISIAAVNYPYITQESLQEVLCDVSRAVKFFRFNAEKFNIDPENIFCYGSSAGAGSSLFLATEPDFLFESENDEISRTSAKIKAAGLYKPQSTYDFYKWAELLEMTPEELLEKQPEFGDPLTIIYGEPICSVDKFFEPETVKIREYLDLCEKITENCPPLFVRATVRKEDKSDLLHAQIFARKIFEKALEKGVYAELETPEKPARHADFIEFVVSILNGTL